MSESMQKKVGRVRKPRVHITMDIETEGGIEKVELPFVVGVLGDLSGDSTEPLKPLKDRKFVRIGKDNFNDVLASMTPGLTFKVENTLKGDGSEMGVQLQFKSMDDFSPANVARQVTPLRELLDRRQQLKDLAAQTERSDDFESVVEELMKDPAAMAAASGAPEEEPPAGGGDDSGGGDGGGAGGDGGEQKTDSDQEN